MARGLFARKLLKWRKKISVVIVFNTMGALKCIKFDDFLSDYKILYVVLYR